MPAAARDLSVESAGRQDPHPHWGAGTAVPPSAVRPGTGAVLCWD